MQEQLLKGASRASSQSFSCGQRLHNASLVPAVPLAPGKRQLSLPCPRMEVQRLPSILTRHQGFSSSNLTTHQSFSPSILTPYQGFSPSILLCPGAGWSWRIGKPRERTSPATKGTQPGLQTSQ